ncbi:MAG: hypothetical protein ACW98F_18070 [Candidatus Hodarchaeales archaeon]|jgi:hypothetical protein
MESSSNMYLITKNHSILLKKEKIDFKLLFQSRIDGKWQVSASVPLLTLEDGSSIWANETPVKTIDRSQILFQLKNRRNNEFEIITEIDNKPEYHPWIHFKTTVKFVKDYKFNVNGPEIRIDLVPRIHPSENIISIQQPTRHTPSTDEWKSNDMPATAVWNPESNVRSFFFMDFSTMDWMSPENIERFSIYECGIAASGTLGLIHRIPLKSPITFPKESIIVFDYYFLQEYHEDPPTQWDLMENLIKHCFRLIPGSTSFPKAGLNWTDFSKGCINDLMKEKYCWIDPNFPKYFAYVMDDAERKRREAIGKTNFFETMTLLSLLPPWMLYSSLDHNPVQENHLRLMYKTLNHFVDPNSNFFHNNIYFDPSEGHIIIKATEHSIGDSWYFFEPILRLGWVIRLAPSLGVKQDYIKVFRNMVERSTEFVQKHRYEITAFYDPFSLKPLHEILDEDEHKDELLKNSYGEEDIIWKKKAKNYACLGIHLYIVIEAYYLFQDSRYLEEATKSAKKLATFSPDTLFWEPFEIAYAVSGLAELANITKDNTYLELSKKYLFNELRMFYWYNDNSFDWKGKRSNLGLPMACIGIRYPAVKENVESVLPWLMYLKTALTESKHDLPIGVLKFMNLIRINTFNFFSSVLPKEFIYPPRRNSPCPFIPFEDLEMLETPHHFSSSQEHSEKGTRTGTLGREIYGAGEIIYLYLMFEALAKSANPDVMVLNLDLFDFSLMNIFPPKTLNFIIYNPLVESTDCQISFYTNEQESYEMQVYTLGTSKETRKLSYSPGELNSGINFDLGKEEILNVILTPSE